MQKPKPYLALHNILLTGAFEDACQNHQIASLIFYQSDMNNEQKKRAHKSICNAIIQPDYHQTTDLNLSYVQDYLHEHQENIEIHLLKNLQRKRSMQGTLKAIVQWKNIFPHSTSWSAHLNHELNKWKNTPSDEYPADELEQVIRCVDKNHPKFSLLMTYFLQQLDLNNPNHRSWLDTYADIIFSTDEYVDIFENNTFFDVEQIVPFLHFLKFHFPKMSYGWRHFVYGFCTYEALNKCYIDNIHTEAITETLILFYHEHFNTVEFAQQLTSFRIDIDGPFECLKFIANHYTPTMDNNDVVDVYLRTAFDEQNDYNWAGFFQQIFGVQSFNTNAYNHHTHNNIAKIIDRLVDGDSAWQMAFLIFSLLTKINDNQTHYQSHYLDDSQFYILEKLMTKYPQIKAIIASQPHADSATLIYDVINTMIKLCNNNCDTQGILSIMGFEHVITFNDDFFTAYGQRIRIKDEKPILECDNRTYNHIIPHAPLIEHVNMLRDVVISSLNATHEVDLIM